MNVGFIGIGQMGKHMAKHILDAGYSVIVHDLKKEAANNLLEKGATWGKTPKEIAESCRVVISSLPTPQDVEQVVYGENGLNSGWKDGDIYVDMSTNSPLTIRRIAEDAKSMGVAVLDAPVSGGTRGAEMGTLAIMVGGDSSSLEMLNLNLIYSFITLAVQLPSISPCSTQALAGLLRLSINRHVRKK